MYHEMIEKLAQNFQIGIRMKIWCEGIKGSNLSFASAVET